MGGYKSIGAPHDIRFGPKNGDWFFYAKGQFYGGGGGSAVTLWGGALNQIIRVGPSEYSVPTGYPPMTTQQCLRSSHAARLKSSLAFSRARERRAACE